MSKTNTATEPTKFDFNLSRMKENVEGEGSQTAITLTGPLSPEDVYKALMNVNTDEVQDKCEL